MYGVAVGRFGSHPSDCLCAKMADTSFKNVAEFRYFRVTPTNQTACRKKLRAN
jgi:hypothetical protein